MRFRHLKEKRLSYCEHLTHAFYYSFASCKAAIFFFIHGLYPDVFETAGSDTLREVIHRLDGSITKKDKSL
jgi:hypothetical protein